MIAILIPIQTPQAPDKPVFDFLFFPLATSRGNPGGFWNLYGRHDLRLCIARSALSVRVRRAITIESILNGHFY